MSPDPSRRLLPRPAVDPRVARASAVLAARQAFVTLALAGALVAAATPAAVVVTAALVGGAWSTGRADTPTSVLAAGALLGAVACGGPAEVGALLASAVLTAGGWVGLLVGPLVLLVVTQLGAAPVDPRVAAPGLLALALLPTFLPAVHLHPVDRLPRPAEVDATLPAPWSQEAHAALDVLGLLPAREQGRLVPLVAEVYRASTRLHALDRVLDGAAGAPDPGSRDLAAVREEVHARRGRTLAALRSEVVRRLG